MTVYISGPMTGHEDYNFPAFHAAADTLRAAGFDVVNPADFGVMDGWEWHQYLRRDIKMLVDCEAILMLPGWPTSRGAALEFRVAFDLGLRIFYGVEDVTLGVAA